MEIPSLKKTVIVGLASALSIDDLKNNSLIFVTSSGIITGKPTSDEELEKLREYKFNDLSSQQLSLNIISTLVDTTLKSYDEQYAVKHPISGNDGYIILKDVVCRSSGAVYNLPSIILFFDQIVGISAGKLDT